MMWLGNTAGKLYEWLETNDTQINFQNPYKKLYGKM